MTGTKCVTRTSSGRTEQATGSASAGGRDASLGERHKAATRSRIGNARAAPGLFVANGLRATRAESIARAAGVAPRPIHPPYATWQPWGLPKGERLSRPAGRAAESVGWASG
ncbi:hypothetical protein [Streptomyces hygroscopicus]|uniref:hypothetical protein n=1 Tax=Streptomyces hygroscopicus TaxID=1912 RepID=UPI003A0FFDBB